MEEASNAAKLKLEQSARAKQEARLAQTSDEPEEAAAHERRADKASYLRAKLAEQQASQRESKD